MPRLAVGVSGTGTLLEAMIARKLEISFVFADRQCRGYDIAREHGIACLMLPHLVFTASFDRDQYTRYVNYVLDERDIDVFAMAGFMTVLAPLMFEGRYRGRVLNTHPSLLPKFKGAHAVRDAFNAGEQVSGCTIHVATEELDSGEILAQARVARRDDDTVESWHERIKVAERALYPRIIESFMLTRL